MGDTTFIDRENVFGKLSRIFETHTYRDDGKPSSIDEDDLLEGIMSEFGLNESYDGDQRVANISGNSPRTRSPARDSSINLSFSNRPTPFDVWRSKQKDPHKGVKPTPRLNGQQWDQLVEKMHQSGKLKNSAMVKDQNTSLALELGGFEFKPHINEHSKKLSVSMKKLCTRIDEIQSERERFLLQKKKESDEAEVAGCTFEPTRYSEKTSDLYLRRMGREEKVKPEDLFKYQQDKMRRNELRRQILREIEEKELTFKPALNEKTIKIQEKMVQQGSIDVDQVTRTTRPTAAAQSRLVAANLSSSSLPHSLIKDKDKDKDKDGMVVVDGPTLVVESVHPYKHNTSEYSTVQVPGAVSYSVSFSDNTRTEAIYDFVRFYDDETHTHHFGSGKYSGGTNGSPMNWPGVGNRPALFIPSPKFVIYFKTNGSVNDWGFKMHITPHISVSVHLPPPPASPSLPGPGQSQSQGQSQGHGHLSSVALLQPDPHIPSITAAARNYGQSKRQGQGQVHERLYQQGLEMKTDRINYQADLFQSKIKNLPLKPWEAVRDPHGQQQPAHKHIKMYGKTYLAKATLAEAVEELLLPPPPPPPASRRTRGRGEANQDQDFYGEGDGDGEQKDGDGGQGDGEGDFQGEGDVRQTASSYSAAYATVFTAVEFDDSLAALWRDLRNST